MSAHPVSRRSRRALAALLAGVTVSLLGVAPASSGTASHSAADGAGANATGNLAQFAVNSPAMIQAELIATRYWNTSPCSGVVSVSWGSLDQSINASSNWWNPVAAYGNAAANSQCTITLNQNQNFDWPMFCSVMVHEIGHLVGQQHTTDRSSVMYPIYVAPIPECKGSDAGAPAPAPVAAQATAAKHAAKGSHKAQSRNKKHKHANKHAKKHA